MTIAIMKLSNGTRIVVRGFVEIDDYGSGYHVPADIECAAYSMAEKWGKLREDMRTEAERALLDKFHSGRWTP